MILTPFRPKFHGKLRFYIRYWITPFFFLLVVHLMSLRDSVGSVVFGFVRSVSSDLIYYLWSYVSVSTCGCFCLSFVLWYWRSFPVSFLGHSLRLFYHCTLNRLVLRFYRQISFETLETLLCLFIKFVKGFFTLLL